MVRIKKIVEQDLGTLIINSSSSHFFNEAELDQYLFELSTGQLNNRKWKYLQVGAMKNDLKRFLHHS